MNLDLYDLSETDEMIELKRWNDLVKQMKYILYWHLSK